MTRYMLSALLLSAVAAASYGQCRTGTVCAPPSRVVSYVAPSVVSSFRKAKKAAPPVATATATITIPSNLTTPPAFTPGWREEAIKLARNRDEYSAYLKTLDVLGFQGQKFGLSDFGLTNNANAYAGRRVGASGYSYGTDSSSSLTSSTSYAGYGGQTGYGYSLKDAVDLYSPVNIDASLQQAGLLNKAVLETMREGQGLQADNIKELVVGANRVAEIREMGKTARAALEAARAPASTSTTTATTGATVRPVAPPAPAAEGTPPPAVMPPASDAETSASWKVFFATDAGPACAKCHGADTKNDTARKAFALENLPALSAEGKMLVLSAVFTTMPKDPAGKHVVLPAAALKRWSKMLSQ